MRTSTTKGITTIIVTLLALYGAIYYVMHLDPPTTEACIIDGIPRMCNVYY